LVVVLLEVLHNFEEPEVGGHNIQGKKALIVSIDGQELDHSSFLKAMVVIEKRALGIGLNR
jgi:hypothetical protein